MPAPLHRYEPIGLQAVDPRAFFEMFLERNEVKNAQSADGSISIVDIDGPLRSGRGYWCESYESILERVQDACTDSSRIVALRINSPGGDVAGMLECAQAIRDSLNQSGKSSFTLTSGHVCSAAYALASATDQIFAGPTAVVGSLGVIDCRRDYTAMNDERGVKVAFVSTGAFKADGNPDTSITPEELARKQRLIDSVAEPYFEWIAARRGTTVEALKALEAGVFSGADAVAVGLVDAIKLQTDVLSAASDGSLYTNGDTMEIKAMLASLEKDAASKDPKTAATAKRMLAAYKAEETEVKPEDKKDPKAKAETDEEEPKAEADEEEIDAEADPEDKPAAMTAPAVSTLVAQMASMQAEIKAMRVEKVKEARAALIASRPDMTKEMKALVAKLPLADARLLVAALPAPTTHKAETVVPTTQGNAEGTRRLLPPKQAAAMAAAMGLGDRKEVGVHKIGNRVYLGVPKGYQPPEVGDGKGSDADSDSAN